MTVENTSQELKKAFDCIYTHENEKKERNNRKKTFALTTINFCIDEINGILLNL